MAQFVLNNLTLSNINRFSKFFHCQNKEKICNNIITKDHTCAIFWPTLYNGRPIRPIAFLRNKTENKTRYKISTGSLL